MNPALYKLMLLQGKAMLRRMGRGGKSPTRILVFLVGAVIFLSWVTLVGRSTLKYHAKPERVREMMPLALLGMCIITAVSSAGDKAIAFTPGEVDQLFPGPFTRREIVAFKFAKSTFAAILTTAVLSVPMMRYGQWWPACFAAVFFTLLLIQWFTVALLLSGQELGQAAYSRLRQFIIIGAFVLIIVIARMWMAAGVHQGEAAVVQFEASALGQVVLAPLKPFAELMLARSPGELLKWASLAAALDAGLVTIVFLLDQHYVEAAAAASERRYAKIQQVRAGAFLSLGVAKTSHWRLPMLPRLGGVGPIAWRQLTSAARSSRGLLLMLLFVAVLTAPMLASAKQNISLLIGIACWVSFLCSSMLSFDFRGDIDHMEVLKALPVSTWGIIVGQLVAPVALLSAFHVTLLGIAAVMMPAGRGLILAAMVLTLPFNALLFAAENLVFLLFPTRPAAATPGDFQVMGRKFLLIIIKMAIVVTGLSVAIAGGVITWQLSHGKLPIATAVGWTLITAEVVALVPLLSIAFRRFDPSIHTPA